MVNLNPAKFPTLNAIVTDSFAIETHNIPELAYFIVKRCWQHRAVDGCGFVHEAHRKIAHNKKEFIKYWNGIQKKGKNKQTVLIIRLTPNNKIYDVCAWPKNELNAPEISLDMFVEMT